MHLDWVKLLACGRDGGTGRRARLKIWWALARVGSIPSPGTTYQSKQVRKCP
jgi:hypothetical protein